MRVELASAGTGLERVRWRCAGAGPPLVLVHGVAGSWRWWRPVLPALAAERRVHMVDLPGFGGRPLTRRFDLDAALDWLERWMGAAGFARADLLGHSLGGLLCARLAARRPEAVRRLVLVSPAGVPDRTVRDATGQLGRALLASRPGFLALLARDVVRAGPVTTLSAALAALGADVRDELASVTAPTLLVLGGRDPLVPPAHGLALAAALPTAELRVVAGAGHVPMFDRPAELSREVLRFLGPAAV